MFLIINYVSKQYFYAQLKLLWLQKIHRLQVFGKMKTSFSNEKG